MTTLTQVHQFHPSTAVGDAVTGDMLELQRVLREAGFVSEIYAHHVAVGLEKLVRPLSQYSRAAGSLLIVHHSMGYDDFDQVVGLPGRKILRYHNITPAHFLPSLHLKTYAEIGRRQLLQYREHVELAIAASEYSRQELISCGYRYSCTVPILFRPGLLLAEKPDSRQMRALAGNTNLLFVGRICPNKKQDDLISIFNVYHRRYNPQARLLLVGSWEGTENYAEKIRSQIKHLGLEQAVWLPGKITATELAAAYRRSTALVCASEHEGFCVPLLEAMGFDLPVIAYHAAAVPETLGPAGVLLDSKDPELWCEVMEELLRNAAFREEILQKQRQRLAELQVERSGALLLELIRGLSFGPLQTGKPVLQIQGPFETSYSLAVINRNLALALDQEGTCDVSIHCTEGPGDYVPKESDLADKPHARWLWQKAAMLSHEPDIVIRDLYPPRVHDMPGGLRLLYFFWEDSLICSDWAAMFNVHLDAVLVPSHHVEQVLRQSGVTIPLLRLHPGIEEHHLLPRSGKVHKPGDTAFTFLHISSGFPRKGIDVLLQAFFTEFTRADDVTLVLKTFPNIHNDVAEQLAGWRARMPDGPECVHIDRDLDADALADLYQSAGCAVYPSRAEGFGLPIAEAMARRIPVITTAYGGQTDFCTSQNSFLLDFTLVPSGSHLNVPGAKWAEPDCAQLRACMRLVYSNRNSPEIAARVEAAFRSISGFRWSSSSRELAALWSGLDGNCASGPRLAMVTSWDSRCGIAEYSRYLLEAVREKRPGLEIEVLSSPQENLWRDSLVPARACWTGADDRLEGLRRELARGRFDAVHFQFNFGFFSLEPLANIIRELKQAGKAVLVTFHSTADTRVNGKLASLGSISAALQLVDLILVHSQADQDRLASFGISDNVRLIHHGTIECPPEEFALRRELGIPFQPAIGTFGFLLPHKGLLELLQAVHLLRRDFPGLGLLAQCALHHDPVSQQFERKVRAAIGELNLASAVLLSTEFLAPEEVVLLMQMADVLVLPYGQTTESSSAAIRFAIAAGRPVITTQQHIFHDVREAVYQIPDNHPERLAEAIRGILADSEAARVWSQRVRAYAQQASWPRVAQQYLAHLQEAMEKPAAAQTEPPQHSHAGR